jgi:hypothetical protein
MHSVVAVVAVIAAAARTGAPVPVLVRTLAGKVGTAAVLVEFVTTNLR